MSFASSGAYTRPSNTFSNPVVGQPILPTDADSLFDDGETAFNSTFLARQLFLSLSASQVGTDVNTAQSWFPGGGATGITLAAATSYFFEGLLAHKRTAGTTSHTIGNLFGGTATLTSIGYMATAYASDTANFIFGTVQTNFVAVATNTTIWNTASTSADQTVLVRVRGLVRVNAAGTFIPQFQFSAAPGGAPTVQANSFFMLSPIGTNTVLNQGSWT